MVYWSLGTHLRLGMFLLRSSLSNGWIQKLLGSTYLGTAFAKLECEQDGASLTDVYVLTADQIAGMLDQSAVCQTFPLLVVEVVSPDSIKRDYRYKRSEYAALEIPEYWIVDPLDSKVSVLLWNDGLYEEFVSIGTQIIASKIFPNLKLTVEQVIAAGNGESVEHH
jgi:Putative restriction endonuclease